MMRGEKLPVSFVFIVCVIISFADNERRSDKVVAIAIKTFAYVCSVHTVHPWSRRRSISSILNTSFLRSRARWWACVWVPVPVIVSQCRVFFSLIFFFYCKSRFVSSSTGVVHSFKRFWIATPFFCFAHNTEFQFIKLQCSVSTKHQRLSAQGCLTFANTSYARPDTNQLQTKEEKSRPECIRHHRHASCTSVLSRTRARWKCKRIF